MRAAGNFIRLGRIHCPALNASSNNILDLGPFFGNDLLQSINKDPSDRVFHDVDLANFLLQKIFDVFIIDFIEGNLDLCFDIGLVLDFIKQKVDGL